MLEVLFGSKLRAKVLGWLYAHPDERFYVRQLTSLLDRDSTNVSRELARLAKTGILVSTTEGKQKYYQANSKSHVFNELHGLILKTVGVADVLRSAFIPVANNLQFAFIFGSIANSMEKKRSDIDLLVVGKLSFGNIVKLLQEPQKKLGREINPVVYSAREFKRNVHEQQHFIESVLAGEKIFIIGSEDELGRLAGRRAFKKA
jgi:uncharacterized protein